MASTLKKVPWHAVLQGGYAIRRIAFSREASGHPELTVEAPLPEVKRAFMEENLASGWLFAYHYEGEDANLRRAEYNAASLARLLDHGVVSEAVWEKAGYSKSEARNVIAEVEDYRFPEFQFHVRLFGEDTENGEPYTRVKPHHEVDPLTHPKAHIREEMMNYAIAFPLAGKILHDHGFSFSG